MATPDTPIPDPAALAALLERAADALDNHMVDLEFEGLVRVPRLVRADAAALRAWAPLLVAAVEGSEAWSAYAQGVWQDSPMTSEELTQHHMAISRAQKRYKEGRAALASGAGEVERG